MTMEVDKKKEEEYSIKPQAVTPAIDTSSWPLLLKNYDKRERRQCFARRSVLSGETLLTCCSACENGPFHTDSQWLLPVEARHQVVHQLWRDQSRQALEPVQP